MALLSRTGIMDEDKVPEAIAGETLVEESATCIVAPMFAVDGCI
jgi:hypothetical protein